jgi:hypothetical protein
MVNGEYGGRGQIIIIDTRGWYTSKEKKKQRGAEDGNGNERLSTETVEGPA